MLTSFVVALAVQCIAAKTLPIYNLNNIDNSVNDKVVSSDGRRLFVEIIGEPNPARHSLGETTELTCVAVGHPAPRVTWMKNNVPYLQDDLDSNDIVDSSITSFASVVSILQIITAPTQKEDIFTCVAESALKTAQASTTVYNDIDSVPPIFTSVSMLNRHLLAAPRAPRIVERARSLFGNVGTTLVLPCRVSGNPQPQVYWHKKDENEPITSTSRVQITESGDLMFREALWSDMGVYVCTAKNDYGKDIASTFFYPVVTKKVTLSQYNRL